MAPEPQQEQADSTPGRAAPTYAPPKSPRTPKSTIRIGRQRPAARLPRVGDEILIRAKVTRVGRNTVDTADTITVRIGDHPAPITATAKYLLLGEE